MYENGQPLTEDVHFTDHIGHDIPVQIYLMDTHNEIGHVQEVLKDYIKINDCYYRRDLFRFLSRPGY
jgi:ribosome maturation factor RimP